MTSGGTTEPSAGSPTVPPASGPTEPPAGSAPSPTVGGPHRREGEGRRAIVLVDNSLKAYSRADRFARSLAAAGWETTLVGVAEAGLPVEEKLPPADWPVTEDGAAAEGGPSDGAAVPVRDVRLLRLAPSGPLAGFQHGRQVRRSPIHRVPGLGALARTVGWPLAARAWAETLRDLPPADLYHACGFGAALAASRLARRAKRRGRAGRFVYDAIDILQESDLWYRYPSWRRRLYASREGRVVRAADAMTSVSDEYAADARQRFDLQRTPTVVYNCPPRTEITTRDGPDLIREATGIPPERAVVLFIGRFGPDRGLFEAGDAVLELPDAAFVAMGFGRLEEQLHRRDREPRRAGRHFTLPPVPPQDVTRWSAAADVTIFLAPGDNLNQRDMTPNKLWESLAGGTPVIVGERTEAAQRIVEPEDIGMRSSADVAGLAASLRRLLDAPEAERRARRDRARRLMAERYAWDVTIPGYLRMVAELVDRPAAR